MKLCCTYTMLIFSILVSGPAFRGSATPEKTLSKGKLKGVVVDWQDARVTGTLVVIRSSKLKFEVKTSETGEFETEVPVGAYEVSVHREGFKKFRQKGVMVEQIKCTFLKIQLKSTPTKIKMTHGGVSL
ncbi:MAG: carboxypeptidase-like regulatory domain-containing protein [Terriglobia bacterium]